jgi:hypothetical protein
MNADKDPFRCCTDLCIFTTCLTKTLTNSSCAKNNHGLLHNLKNTEHFLPKPKKKEKYGGEWRSTNTLLKR